MYGTLKQFTKIRMKSITNHNNSLTQGNINLQKSPLFFYRWYYLFVCDGRFSEGKRIPDGWFHVALVYNTTCSQLKVYQNGVLVERATKVSQNYIPGSGKVKIGYGFTYRHEYGSVDCR